MKRYTVTINQAQIAAPSFPRPLAWWRTFLPIWFSHPEAKWWTEDYKTLVNDRVTLDETGTAVSIAAHGRDHAHQMMDYLLRSSLCASIEDPTMTIVLHIAAEPESATCESHKAYAHGADIACSRPQEVVVLLNHKGAAYLLKVCANCAGAFNLRRNLVLDQYPVGALGRDMTEVD